jgi:hypothetical protein
MATAGQAAPGPFPAICAADSPFASSADLPQSWSTEDEKASSFFLLESTSIPQKNDVVALYLVTQARK